MRTVGPPAGLEWTVTSRRERAVSDVAFRARAFARAVLMPQALALDARLEADPSHFPWDIVRDGAGAGWLGAAVPRAWGGEGVGIAAMSAAIEEMCAVDAGLANVFGAHALGMLPILLSMDVDLGARLLGEVTRAEKSGSPKLCAFAITEPAGGSDVEERAGLASIGASVTRADRGRGGYRLSGRKLFISNGGVAELVVVFAALDVRAPHESWTAFAVRSGTSGVSWPRVEHKMGQRACPAAELVLDGAFVPDDLRVGGEGEGWELTRRVLAVSRGPVGAIGVGIARGAYEAVLAFARAEPRSLSPAEDALGRMVVAIRAARAAYLEAGTHCDGALLPSPLVREIVASLRAVPRALLSRLGDSPSARAAWAHQAVLASTAKIAGSDAAMAVTTAALDLIPPWGGEPRALAEKAFRDAKLTQIYEGTNQINVRTIAHESFARRTST